MPRRVLSLALLPLFAIATFVPQVHAAPLPVEDVTAIQPQRVLDTRAGLGAPMRRLDAGVDLAVSVSPPAGATSVVVNITAVDASLDGWIKAWPCDEPQSTTSSLNFTPGITAANAAIVRLAGGKVCLASNVAVNVVMDVTGWFFGTSDFAASSPNRLLDSRITGDPLQPLVERRLKVAGTPGISGSATIAALNITVDRSSRPGWVVAYPCGQPTDASTVNFSAGEIVANFTLVGLSGGDVCLKSLYATQIVVDSFGWSTGAGSVKVQSPTRLLDTRDNVAWGRGPSPSGGTLNLRVAGRAGVPLTADAAILTVTVDKPTGEGFVTVWPCDQPFPLASTINTFPNALRSNLTLVKLSVVEGEACLQYRSSNNTPTELIVDVVGWITGNTPRSANSGCSIAGAAFCETFDGAAGNGGRSGDLDPVLWGVSRLGEPNPGQGLLNRYTLVNVKACGTNTRVAPPGDVRVCGGRLFEAVNDADGNLNMALYPKQPFDFAGRTGVLTFDVSADSSGSHAAWPEFFVTDKPVPGVRAKVSGVPGPTAANSIGFALHGGCNSDPTLTSVGAVFASRNYVYDEPDFTQTGCVKKSTAGSAALNHFEVRLSTNRLEVWGTDPGSSTLKQLAVANNLNLTFTKGLVWFGDVHYNAVKGDPNQTEHTFAWDNLGFDGPKTYRDLSFDVPDANVLTDGGNKVTLGYLLQGTGPRSFTPAPVFRQQAPTGAIVTLNFWSYQASVPSVSINGGPWIDTPWPFDPDGYFWRSIAIPVDVNQIHDGANTISLKSNSADTIVSNINLILIAGAPVP